MSILSFDQLCSCTLGFQSQHWPSSGSGSCISVQACIKEQLHWVSVLMFAGLKLGRPTWVDSSSYSCSALDCCCGGPTWPTLSPLKHRTMNKEIPVNNVWSALPRSYWKFWHSLYMSVSMWNT